MATDPAELRKVRGNAKGQVTRTSNLISKMKDLPLTEYDLDTLERYNGQLAKQITLSLRLIKLYTTPILLSRKMLSLKSKRSTNSH